MEKTRLKTGDVVETTSGKIGMILRGTHIGDIVSGEELWFPLTAYQDDLKNKFDHNADISRVYRPQSAMEFLHYGIITEHPLIWKRTKIITQADAEVALKEYYNCDIEIED